MCTFLLRLAIPARSSSGVCLLASLRSHDGSMSKL
jgi:hypothetical protein